MTDAKFRGALATAIVLLAVVSGVGLRAYGIWEKSVLEHDEGISYLSATGHLGEYEVAAAERAKGSLTGRWVKASQWKRLLEPNTKFSFALIGHDLAHYDIHPPFYFWLLHIWVLILGVHLWTGPLLNIVIFVFTAVVLFSFAGRIFRDRFEGALATLLWALSPAAVTTSLIARQYDLATLFAVLFAWLTCSYAYERRSSGLRFSALLAMVTAAGILSHYQFLLIVVPVGCLVLIATLFKRNVRKLAIGLASIASGCLVAFVLHPQFFLSFHRARENAESLDVMGLFHRILVVLAGFGGFFTALLQRITDSASMLGSTDTGDLGPSALLKVLGWTEWALIGATAFVLTLLIISAVVHVRKTWTPRDSKEFFFSPTGYALAFGVGMAGAIVLGYLTFLFPDHAMRERHLSILWPFAALWLVFLLRFCGNGKLYTAILIVFMALSSVSFSAHLRYVNSLRENPEKILSTADRIVFDTVERGTLLPVLWHVSADTLVHVDRQWNLPREPHSWLDRLDRSSLFVSVLRYGGTMEGQERILELVRQRFCVERTQGFVWRWTTLFRMEDCKK